jgi:hypothetical protein
MKFRRIISGPARGNHSIMLFLSIITKLWEVLKITGDASPDRKIPGRLVIAAALID